MFAHKNVLPNDLREAYPEELTVLIICPDILQVLPICIALLIVNNLLL